MLLTAARQPAQSENQTDTENPHEKSVECPDKGPSATFFFEFFGFI
jgi:hypothetical protein